MVVTQADRQATTSAFLEYLHGPQRPVLVFDGATGTSLQGLGLTADDFGGPDLEGCNENLAVTKPCLLYTSPSPRDGLLSRMPSSA